MTRPPLPLVYRITRHARVAAPAVMLSCEGGFGNVVYNCDTSARQAAEMDADGRLYRIENEDFT